MNNRGQFSIIAALLVAIILAGTLIAVYSTIRYGSSQSQSPQTLIATDETNSAFQKALGFTVGYYGSILQVTGNQTYAYANATIYMNSALQYIASMNPSWGESIKMTSLNLSTNWFSNPSISTGKLSVVYDLQNLGIYGINYTTSCSLGLQIFNSPNSNQVCLNVTQDLTEPLTSLGQQNFAFYFYNYSISDWQLVNPSLTPTIFTNGTYLINIPSEIDDSAYMVQVTDSRGIMVEASSFNSYNINFTFGSQSTMQNTPVIVELLQNGTMRWFGQDILNATQTRSIPPIPIKSLHLCQTGSTSDLPFQVEDWASQYQIPLGMSSNYTIFSNNQMVVFEVSPSMSQLTLWWNGSDTAIQPSTAYTNTYFTADNPAAGTLTNGNITLQFSYPNSAFQIKSIVGNVSSTANFMRIDADPSTYGSGLAYIIQHGVVRDIVQEEAEWSNGATNCPNVYSQIVFTLPANATYFTYQLRLISINSTAARNINDISPIQLTTSISQPQAMTENGIANGIPNVTNGTGTFNNSTGNAHHWSQLINNVTLQGTGIMFTDSANQQLYAFDSMAGKFTGALYVNTSVPVIELDPVTSAGSVNFTSPLDLTWYGAVATFSGANPLYTNNGNSGLWPLVEQPPSATITPESASAASIHVSPSADPAGTSVTVSGGGFIPNSPITITFNGNTVATTTANAYGVIPSGTTFVIPSGMPGSYVISAYDTGSNSASANFTLTLYPMETVTFQPSRISSDASSATILTIDSVQYTYSTLPISFTWQAGSTHTITASSTIAAGTGKQYIWASWSDGGAQTHNYTVPSSSATVTANYNTQYQVTFNYQVSGGGSGYSAPSVTYYQSGSQLSVTVGPSATVWVDSGSTYTYTNNPLTGSGSSERWYASSGTSETISSSTTINPTYYNQYMMTLSYSVNGGGSGYSAPTFAANQYGASAPQTLTTTATGYWFDAGSSWSVTNPLTGSGSSERWQTSQSTSGTVSATTIAFTYYNQYSFTLSDSVSGGGSGYSAPTLTAKQFGSSYTPTLGTTGTQYWLDAGQSWSVTNPLSGSGSSQRWQTQTASGTVGSSSPTTAGGSLTFTYYNQYSITFQYSVSGGGSGYSAPTVTYTQFGTGGYTLTAVTSGGTAIWVDAGTTYSYTNPLSGSGSSEQWATSSATGTASASATVSKTYYNQYMMTLSYSVNGGGSGYSAPTFAANQYGASAPQTLTTTATGYWFDAGASWTVTNPLGGSSGTERWYTSQAVSGTVSATTIAFVYYNQYQVTFDASSNVKSDSSATIVTVAGTGYTGAQLPYTNWFNAGSLTYSYASPIGSSSSSTTGYYWGSTSGLGQTLQSNTFTLGGSGTITATYTTQTFGIDTNCEGFGSVSSGRIITTSSMTAQANELIVVAITGSSSSPTVSSITDSFGTHLTYTSRVSYTSSTAGQCLYVYYALTGTHTGSFTITVTMSSNYKYCVQAFGITGANTATPFDPNPSLPAKAIRTSSSVPTVTGVSTSNAYDMILAFEGQKSSTAQTAGSSFTAPAALLHNANSLGNNVEYKIVTSTQSSVSVSFGTSVTPWMMAVEAVQRAW